MRNRSIGMLAAGLLAASAQARSWEVASYTPSAVAPQLPTAVQAVALKQMPRTPLWWLRRPHRLATEQGWIGVPARSAQHAAALGARQLGDRAVGGEAACCESGAGGGP